MNVDYLYSIMNLYLKKEKRDIKTNLEMIKKNENIEFNFSMDFDNLNKTSFFISNDLFEDNYENILALYQNNMVVKDEKYNYNPEKDKCVYVITFNNGRKLSLKGFSIETVKKIRNYLYNPKTMNDLNVNDSYNINLDIFDKKVPAYTGFASFKSILLISIFFLVILIVSILYFMK